jgi:tRNA 2-selenouridine synthase
MTTSPDAPSILTVSDAEPATLAGFDAIIDVRSPSEFAEDHAPGAINLPVLNDAERAEVGTLYVRSRFEARRLGAALVARNIAAHLDGALAGRPADFRPLVYCWRGGQRSHAMATVLSQVGWRTGLMAGGYRTYRRRVQATLYENGPALKLVLIDGNTGTGKTDMLHRLAARGLQTLDLEGLANHRGSLLGGRGEQPPQKLFETKLLQAIEALDPSQPIVVEAESSKIGERMTPPLLWRDMQGAPRIVLEASNADRARYLVGAYRDIIEDRAALEAALDRLPFRAGPERRKAWRGTMDGGDFEALARALMELHYDPAYARSAKRDERRRLGALAYDPTDPASAETAADRIVEMVRSC